MARSRGSLFVVTLQCFITKIWDGMGLLQNRDVAIPAEQGMWEGFYIACLSNSGCGRAPWCCVLAVSLPDGTVYDTSGTRSNDGEADGEAARPAMIRGISSLIFGLVCVSEEVRGALSRASGCPSLLSAAEHLIPDRDAPPAAQSYVIEPGAWIGQRALNAPAGWLVNQGMRISGNPVVIVHFCAMLL